MRLAKYIKSGTRQGWLIGAAIFLLAFLLRLNFRSRRLYSWDAANFALGLLRYSPRDHMPDPPGYPLYILSGRLLNLVVSDPNASLVLLSIICGAISVAAIYFAGEKMFDRKTGIIAAWLMLFSPLVWFQSEVALSHIVELPFVLILSWLFYEVFQNRRFALAAAIVLGVAGGFRQDVFFLVPLFFICTLRVKDRRQILYAWVAFTVTVLIWLLPLLYLIGGLSEYRSISSAQLQSAVANTAFWNVGTAGILGNLTELWRALLWLFGFSCLGFVFVWLWILISGKALRFGPGLWLLLLLPVPAFVFFIATGFSHPGYALIGSPLMLILARLLTALDEGMIGTSLRPMGLSLLLKFFLACTIGNSWLFLAVERFDWLSPVVRAPVQSSYDAVSLTGINYVDNNLDAWVPVVERSDAGSTLVISIRPMDYGYFGSYSRQLIFYLRDYRVLWLQLDAKRPPHMFQNLRELYSANDDPNDVSIPDQITSVIFVGADPQELDHNLKPVLVSKVGDMPLTVGEFPSQGALKIGPYTIRKGTS
ncbi:MAG: ArnT family glycosyltransferase [Thermoleophilia bacterium]